LYTKPLLDLVRKDVAWRWTEVEERSLRGGIEALIHSHLKGFTKLLYDLPKSLLVCYSDWSKLTNSLNIVLRVKDLRSRAVEPAFFSSKKLPDSYQNKSSTLSEIASLAFGLKTVKYIVQGRPVRCYLDNLSAVYLIKRGLTDQDTISNCKMLHRFLCSLSNFCIEPVFIPGRFQLADFASR
jgi:hypothetical protein